MIDGKEFGFTRHLSAIGMQVLQNNVIPGTTGLQLSTWLHSQGTFKAQRSSTTAVTPCLRVKNYLNPGCQKMLILCKVSVHNLQELINSSRQVLETP